jgi:dihydroceramidase
MFVGTGSFLFHSTLKCTFHIFFINGWSQDKADGARLDGTDPMQLVDELSMIYSTCLMSYAAFSFAKSNTFRVFLAIGLVGLAVFITLYYHYLQDPAFHQNAYALLTIIVLTRSMYVMEVNLRPSLTKKQETYKLERKVSMTPNEKQISAKEDLRDQRILKSMWWMIAAGVGIFLAGFGVWTLDNVYCSTLRRWRYQVGLPWGILLEGHGWWHLMTGVGAYLWLTWGIWLRHCLNGRQDEYDFYWPRLFSFP